MASISLQLLNSIDRGCNSRPVTPVGYGVRRRRGLPRILMSYNPTPAVDRLISATAYTLPFFNSLHYGHHLLMRYPTLASAFEPIVPFVSLYRSVPYASFVSFFALYLGIARNPRFSHYARFNVMQALVMDVLLVVPQVIARILSPGRTGLVLEAVMMMNTSLFVAMAVIYLYSIVSCVLGRTPRMPFVADAAGRQL